MTKELESYHLPVEFPASVADLATGLADVDGDALALKTGLKQV